MLRDNQGEKKIMDAKAISTILGHMQEALWVQRMIYFKATQGT